MSGIKRFIDRYSRALLLIVIIAGLSIVAPGVFFTWDNLSTVLLQQLPLMILMSFGMTLAIITKGIDLSMGSVLVLSSIVSANIIKGGNFLFGIAVALAVGAFCGMLNGILITKVGVAPYIATYGIDWVALGVAYVITGGQYIFEFPPNFRNIANGKLFGFIPNIAVITVVIFAVLWFLTMKTTFGRGMYASGINYNAATLSGIKASSIVTKVYVINGLLAATTGILYMARLNCADPGISGNFTLDSMASALIGGTAMGGGKGSIGKTVIGAMIIILIRNGMNILGVPTTWQQTAIGFIIILSIVMERATQKLAQTATPKKVTV